MGRIIPRSTEGIKNGDGRVDRSVPIQEENQEGRSDQTGKVPNSISEYPPVAAAYALSCHRQEYEAGRRPGGVFINESSRAEQM